MLLPKPIPYPLDHPTYPGGKLVRKFFNVNTWFQNLDGKPNNLMVSANGKSIYFALFVKYDNQNYHYDKNGGFGTSSYNNASGAFYVSHDAGATWAAFPLALENAIFRGRPNAVSPVVSNATFEIFTGCFECCFKCFSLLAS
jgi:hypothetical protein